MPKKVDYCSLEPIFPKKAFMLFLFVLQQDQLIGTVPLESIYASADYAADGVSQTVNEFEGTEKGITIPEECILVPITFHSLYPLRKEFWTNPSIAYNSQMRMKTFLPIIEHPSFYSLLVTPYSYDEKTNIWSHHAAIPIIDRSDTASIEKFMFTSDHVVAPKAKSAAFYTMGEKFRFNWQTKELKTFDNSAKKFAQTYN